MDPTRSNDLPRAFHPGALIADRYRVQAPVGRGGCGWVVRARDRWTGDDVALKVARADVIEELRAARAFTHPNAMRVHDAGSVGPWRFLSMEYVGGESLRARLDRRGPLPAGEALRILRSVARAVAAAHACGIVHRDLKPGNVRFDTGGRVKVLDFGLAGRVGAGRPGAPVGTAESMSPEHVRGLPPATTDDVYAMGVLLFELLAGRPPFHEPSARATAHARLDRPAPDLRALRPDTPDWIADVVCRCLRRSACDRYTDAAALLADLDRRSACVTERPTQRIAPPRRDPALAVAGVAVLAAFTLLGFAAWRPDFASPPHSTDLDAARAGALARTTDVPDLLADGEARVAVLTPRCADDDPQARLVAELLGEAVRDRLQERRDVRLLALEEPLDVDRFGPEHLVEGRVARLGSEIRVVWSVLRLPDRTSVLRESRTIASTDDWHDLDAAGDAFVAAYAALLDAERLRVGVPR